MLKKRFYEIILDDIRRGSDKKDLIEREKWMSDMFEGRIHRERWRDRKS
jgi:hypothetical protein